ncbi:hypothetical protein CGLO_17531 [Colletotrichum gloeosporioides Cg-14]|uniref:Uncharacterized protein n=1 Tax=Colletotrichum gloeosporioides (strain Cg-14) TaxID=1237896 RepID=T0JKS6_COLGC|nr:hypothetical protein CGLO_17531 [Colletotrichum gloeosporioides Cg-14]
MARPYALRA